MTTTGIFVISLDFELFWGVRDKKKKEDYTEIISNTHLIVPRLIKLFNDYGVYSTFATVGFLFAKNKNELVEFSPKKLPNYKDSNLSPYKNNFQDVGEDNEVDPFHYAPKLLELLKKDSKHEIATHTYSHFFCKEEGQTIGEFESDLLSAIKIAKYKGVEINSFVFPRNQYNEDYISVMESNRINTFRGNEDVWFNRSESEKNTTIFKRIARTLDCYINISGQHCYNLAQLKSKKPYNIPSSRFLRPYSNKLKSIEGLKIRRVKRAMKHAAKNGLLYHLWWHPHNFGANTEENFKTLEEILKYYEFLNKKYGFRSKTMNKVFLD